MSVRKKTVINQFLGKSLKTQFILLSFGLTALSIGIVGLLGVRGVLDSGNRAEDTVSSSMQERVKQLLVQTTDATAAKNGTEFKNMQTETTDGASLATNVFDNASNFPNTNWRFDDHVTKQPPGQYMNSLTEPSSVFIQNYIKVTPQIKREIELTSNLDFLFPELIKNEPNAVAVYYIGTQGETRYYPNIGVGNIIPPDYNPTSDAFYTPALPQNNPEKTVRWSTVYDDPAGNGLLITASHPIYTKAGGFDGFIGMDVTLGKVAKNIEDYSPIESSYAFLIDNGGRAIALPAQAYRDILGRAPKKGEFGADLQHVKGDFGTVFVQMRAGKQGFTTARANNTDLYIAYAPVPDTPFSLGIVAKKQVMLQVVSTLDTQVKGTTWQVVVYQMLPIGLVILGLVWLFGYLYIRLITGPLIELTSKTQKVTQGDLNQRMDIISTNEVGKLASAFNTMTMQLSEYYGVLERKVRDRTRALNHKVDELSGAKAKDEAILGSIGDGIIVTDGDGKILLLNAIAAELRGIDSAKAIGKDIKDYPLFDERGGVIHAKDRPMQVALKTRKKVSLDMRSKSKDGTKRAISVTATPVLQGDKVIGAIQIIRDVTKEKEIDRMKTEFISLASHQLRTPLSAIKWFTEMLLSGDAGKLKADQKDFAKNIYDSTERMIELVNSLLNISRIESGRIMVEPKLTDLNELVAGIVNDLKAKTEERKQTLVVSVHKDLPKINLDARLIGQVYLNLLTNAIKYTPKGGEIAVFISRKGKEVLSQVTDTGYGIPKSEQAKMFQKFFRATNIVKVETDGTGLGLYLVKAIIESSGGKIWFESEPGKGTTFWFSLPLSGMKAKEGEVTLDI